MNLRRASALLPEGATPWLPAGRRADVVVARKPRHHVPAGTNINHQRVFSYLPHRANRLVPAGRRAIESAPERINHALPAGIPSTNGA
jgi:hypothetical protein